MNENVLQQNNKPQEGFLAKAMHAGSQVANLGNEVTRKKNAVSEALSDTLENGKREVRRAVKRGYNAAEDLADEAAYRVKHNPLTSVAVAFGLGTAFGVVATGIVRKMTRCD